jgi:flagellar motor switch protein FliG
MDGYEKAAIFLSTVGEDLAAQILRDLDPEDISKISAYMAKTKKKDPEKLQTVLTETMEMVTAGEINIAGEDYIKKVLAKGLGNEDAEKILEMVSKASPLESLKGVSPKALANFLVTEHPQTIALILCLLDPEQAASVIEKLPEHLRADVAMRVACTERIPDNALEEIEEVLKVQLNVNGHQDEEGFEGNKVIAEILNQCDRATEQAILEKIEAQDAELAESIRELMLVFDDLQNIDDRGIQLILKELSNEDLALALKSAPEALKEKIFRNMSQRAVKILQEEMETMGPVKVSDVEAAQQNIVKVARKLDEEGKIIIAGRGGEELIV